MDKYSWNKIIVSSFIKYFHLNILSIASIKYVMCKIVPDCENTTECYKIWFKVSTNMPCIAVYYYNGSNDDISFAVTILEWKWSVLNSYDVHIVFFLRRNRHWLDAWIELSAALFLKMPKFVKYTSETKQPKGWTQIPKQI